MKRYSSIILAVILLLSVVLHATQAYAADEKILFDDTNAVNDRGGAFGKSTGFGFTIPSNSKDYKLRAYVNISPSFGTSRLTVKLATGQKLADFTDDNVTAYDQTLTTGFNGWIDIPIPASLSGSPFNIYSWYINSGSTNNRYDRTMRLQVVYKDVTPPTAPTITLSQPQLVWTYTPIQVAIGGSTDDSGIARYAYNIDGGNWIDYTGPFNAPAGQHTIQSVAYDNNGLSGSWSQPVTTYYDPEKPTPPTMADIDSDKWYPSFPLEFTAGSGGLSGVRGVLYSLSGAMNNSERAYDSNNAQVLSANGTTTVSAVTWSLAGARSEPLTQTIKIDSAGPIGTLSIPPGYAQSMKIHVTAQDNQSGMKSITLPNGQVVEGSEYDYPVTANGRYTFRFTDMLGNVGTNYIRVNTIDTTPPTVPTVTASATTWSPQPVKVTIGGSTDDNSGVNRYVYRIDGGAEQLYTAPVEAPEGQHTIEARSYDNSGLNSDWSVPVTTYYAPKAPAAPALEGLSNSWTNQDVEFTVIPGSDPVAGITSTEYKIGDGDWIEGVKGTITEDGVTTVTARSTNNAGSVASAEGKVYLDKTAPRGLLALSSAGWTKSLSIRATGTDDLSGMDHIVLPSGDVTKENALSYPVTENGDYTFNFVDVAGNITSKTIKVNDIDNSPPIIQTSAVDSSWSDQPRGITYSFKDEQSGLDTSNMYYAWSTSDKAPASWMQTLDPSGTFQQDQPGIWYLHLKIRDALGNATQQVLGPLRIQQVPITPKLSVIGTATDKMLLNWSLPIGGINTDGLKYHVRNETTGQSWTVDYPTNELQDNALTGGTEYQYSVVAENHVGSSPSSSITGVTLPPATVISSVYTSGDDYSKALINIVPVPSATSYRVIATNWTTQEVDADLTVTGTTYQEVSGLKPYHIYDFSVQSINASGAGAVTHKSFLTLPDRPNGFKAAQINEDSIDLSWNSVTRNGVTQDVYGVTDDTYYQLRRDNQIIYNGIFPSFSDKGLPSGMPHDYDAAAGNSTGWGSKAALSQVWTLPSAPKSLQQVRATTDSFTVQLNPPRGATGFQVRIDGQLAANLGSVLDQYTFVGYQPGTTHLLEIAPYNRSGVGKSTNLIVTTLPDLPADGAVKVVAVESDSITIKIDDVPGATKYKLTIGEKEYELSAGETIIHGLQPGAVYDYKLSAGNSAGYGEAYKGHVLTLPASPSNFKVIEHTPTSTILAWDTVIGADHYQVLDASGKVLHQIDTNSYAFTGLEPGSSTTIQIRAINSSGMGAASNFTFRTLPGWEIAPNYDDFMKVKTGVHNVELNWLAVPGADKYRLYDKDRMILETSDLQANVKQLQSAMEYTDYMLVPTNSTGEGKAIPIHAFTTLPADTMEISSESTRDTVTIHLQHALEAEQLVIAQDKTELYRGSAKEYTTFKQEQLRADTSYTYRIWTENAVGDASQAQIIKVRTMKERPVAPVAPVTQEPDAVAESPVTSTPVPDTASTNDKKKKVFVDIDNSFANQSIARLADLGIVNGVSDDRYAPEAGTTRAEFMSMLTRLTLSQEQIKQANSQSLTFTDIDQQGWYMSELRAAIANGIVAGFSKDNFRPDVEIDREQAARMLSAAVQAKTGFDVPAAEGELYTDSSNVSQWARKDVDGLTLTAILQGYPDQTFRPHANLSRAESAVMIDRALQKDMIVISQ